MAGELTQAWCCKLKPGRLWAHLELCLDEKSLNIALGNAQGQMQHLALHFTPYLLENAMIRTLAEWKEPGGQ